MQFHAGHGANFVSGTPSLLPRSELYCHETYHPACLSFPLSDIERTLDALTWVQVRILCSSNADARAIAIAFSSIRSTGVSSTARASFLASSCLLCQITKELRRSGQTAPNRCTPHRTLLRRRGAFAFLLSFQHHDIYRTTLPQRGIDVLVVCCFLSVRGIRAKIERNVLIQEIDTSHPEHVMCAKAAPWAVYANEPPAGQLRLA